MTLISFRNFGNRDHATRRPSKGKVPQTCKTFQVILHSHPNGLDGNQAWKPDDVVGTSCNVFMVGLKWDIGDVQGRGYQNKRSSMRLVKCWGWRGFVIEIIEIQSFYANPASTNPWDLFPKLCFAVCNNKIRSPLISSKSFRRKLAGSPERVTRNISSLAWLCSMRPRIWEERKGYEWRSSCSVVSLGVVQPAGC